MEKRILQKMHYRIQQQKIFRFGTRINILLQEVPGTPNRQDPKTSSPQHIYSETFKEHILKSAMKKTCITFKWFSKQIDIRAVIRNPRVLEKMENCSPSPERKRPNNPDPVQLSLTNKVNKHNSGQEKLKKYVTTW